MGLLAFALVGFYLVFGESREKRALLVIHKAAAAVGSLPGDTPNRRSRRLQTALGVLTSPELTVSIPEFGQLHGRSKVLALVGEIEGIDLEVSIEGATVRIEPSGGARASLMVIAALRVSGVERQERRTVQVVLEEHGEDYRIVRADIGAASKEEPEARP